MSSEMVQNSPLGMVTGPQSAGASLTANIRGQAVTFRVRDDLLLPWTRREVVSTQRVAEMLDVSIRTVMRMCESGELKAYKLREGKTSSPWRICYGSVLDFINRLHQAHGLDKRF